MIKLGVEPRASAVAGFAGGRKTGRYVIRIGCGLKIVRVARVALGREPLKLPRSRAGMAGLAIDGSVRPY